MGREQELSRVTLIGAVINVLLAFGKMAAGALGHSAAMVADAVHSFSDLVSDLVVLVMVKVSSRERDKGHEYGHGKFETLATVGVSLLLMVVGARLMSDGIAKIRSVIAGEHIEVPGQIAFWAAIVSVAVKEFLYRWTARVGKKNDSPATVSNAWHHRSDALSSVGAAAGIGCAILFGGKWAILDPIVGCVISVFIFYVAVTMSVPAIKELTEASLPQELEEEIVAIINSVDGVDDVHALKTRKSGPDIIIEAHVVVKPEMSVAQAHSLMSLAESRLRAKFGENMQIALHVEPSVEAD